MVQRVLWAKVVVNGEEVGQCGKGLVALVGAHRGDDETRAKKLADRVAGMRIFSDAEGKMNLSLNELEPTEDAEVLAISNFTVYGDALASRRPSFMAAAPYEQGERLFQAFVDEMRSNGVRTATGVFGADMKVELLNDGPVTLVVDV